jgi:hypothetical protein
LTHRLTLSSVLAATLVGLILCAGASAGFAGANGAIAFVRDNGSGRTLVTLQAARRRRLPVASPVNHPAWSPDGSKLAYDDGTNVHVVNADGRRFRSPVSFAGLDPSWSPDGSKIAFDDGTNVNVVNADGTPLGTPIQFAGTQAAWAPDGSRIAYVAGTPSDIHVRTLAGADTNLTNSGAADSSPSWSPDGSHIVFVSDRDHPGANTELYTMNADGSNQMRLNPSTLGAASPSWSPDGTRIVFSKPDGGGNDDLWALVLADSSLTQLTTNPADDLQPDWQSAFSVRQPTIDAPNGTVDGAQVTALLHGYTGAAPPTSYAYQWQRCSSAGSGCTAITDATDSSYTLTSLDVDSTVRVVVTGTSAAGTASATSPASTVVTAVAPSNVAAPSITGAVTAAVGTALTADTGTWKGTTPISFSYQWVRCDGNGGSCADISGATGSSYTPVDADVGKTIRVRVTANNGVGSPASSTSGATVPVASSAPANVVAPSVNGDEEIGEVLFATLGTWSGAPTITYAYQWQRCAEGGSCNDIPGATTSSYTIVAADLNQRLRVQIKATNGSGSATAASDQTDKVVGVAPSNSIAPFISARRRRARRCSSAPAAGSARRRPTRTSGAAATRAADRASRSRARRRRRTSSRPPTSARRSSSSSRRRTRPAPRRRPRTGRTP